MSLPRKVSTKQEVGGIRQNEIVREAVLVNR